ncbi:MAG: hypothetical protein FJ276_36695, partial [Planctomycetes bacterium]|nr:hypothetical protein [Planctomycetota bacterium]
MVAFSLLLCAVMAFEDAGSAEYFKITVVDDQTGRGVPLVELRTVNDVRYVTDSAGVVAFHEPGLMGTDVFFEVTGHGYEYPRDGFGFRGARLKAVPGESAVVRISRKNLAERLYRVTGGGIYRDSLLVGESPPIRQPVLNAQVFGSDSVVNAVYRGRVYWFWGDTNRPSYPLGNFHVPGATSRLPADGGLDPEAGIDLEYFVDEAGFARPTAKLPGVGPTWINGLVVVRDATGVERMFARYVKIKPPMTVYESGLVEFDDETKSFVHRVRFPDDAPIMPHGHPLHVVEDGVEYVHFGDPYPDIRVRASAAEVQDLSRYEAYTPLKAGTREKDAEVDRFPDGTVRLAWKRDTPPMTTPLLERLIRERRLSEGEWPFPLRDAVSGKRVVAHRGSVCWNEYRKKYVMITTESHGTSLLGETWYAESDRPVGPWVYARKIVTHEKYSFYNPKQHPMFDKAGGRIIFFEGTYTDTFSGNPDRTPRYNYNQV